MGGVGGGGVFFEMSEFSLNLPFRLQTSDKLAGRGTERIREREGPKRRITPWSHFREINAIERAVKQSVRNEFQWVTTKQGRLVYVSS